MNLEKQRVLVSMKMLKPSVALFLLVISGLAYSAPLTQLNRATGKYLTITETVLHDLQLIICHGDVLMHVIESMLYLW